ncbi:MAG: LptF/LptG family permease [Phycisphaeraceae bacterium]|nr:LptF/LptG family permease [Phycisphaerae bacterium]MBX3392678.1 LptF/LptG family permease [Phycisphaeraceae bacterium]
MPRRRRQPIRLWIHITAELWRLILLTLGVLVSVLAFAVAIKPLADGKIGPAEALRFMGLAVVPMLQYALPFAAGFGATLAYHRFSADNEVVAAHASGVSHRSILAPALLSGIVLSLVLLAMSQQIIPAFLRSMEQMITQDVAKMLVNSIQRGQSVTIGDMRVYADGVARVTNPGPGVADEFILSKVGVVRVDGKNQVKQDFTAVRARVWVMLPGAVESETQDESSSTVIFEVEDAVMSEPGRMMVWDERRAFWTDAGRAFKDDPKFLTFSELRRLGREPDRMNWIDSLRSELATRLMTKAVTERMQSDLIANRRLEMSDAQRRPMVIHASSMQWNADRQRWEFIPRREGGVIDVEIRRSEGPQGVTRISAREVELYPAFRAGPAEQRLVFELRARQAVVRGLDAATGSRDAAAATVAERAYTDLTYEAGQDEAIADKSRTPLAALLGMVDDRVARGGPDPWLTGKRDELVGKIGRLQREILSKQHERFAMSIACLVMVVTGAITAVQLSQSLPLTVYLWSFFPALITVITISTGQQVTHDKGILGLIILWGGVGLLGVYGALGYARLARH